jgi:AbiU2
MVAWLKTISDVVYELNVKRHMFRQVWRLIENNPELAKRQSHVYGWLHDLYAEAMAMAVRRLCDNDDRTVSLARFLAVVKRHPQLVSRTAYASLIPDDTFKAPGLPKEAALILRDQMITRAYDEMFGVGIDQPRGKQIGKEIDSLRRLAANIVEYANKRIAHYDKEPPRQFPELTEIDAVIDNAITTVQKYLLLLTAVSTEFHVIFQYDWMSPFRVVWMPDTPRHPELPSISQAPAG